MFFRKSKCKTEYKKRGFTLAESVLALAVISITSVGTLSLVLSSQRATISAAQKQQAQLYAADIVNCYRVSETYNDFEDNLEFSLGLENTALENALQDNTQNIELKNMTASVEIADETLTVTITDGSKKLTELTFTKGVALSNEETP